jgi:hypothetical protein
MLLLDVVDGVPARAAADLARDFDALLRGRAPSADGPFARLAPLDAGLVCARNRDWIARMHAVADGRVHFYVVPVRNLFAARHDDADCGGLLADLEQAGFTVAPVKSAGRGGRRPPPVLRSLSRVFAHSSKGGCAGAPHAVSCILPAPPHDNDNDTT